MTKSYLAKGLTGLAIAAALAAGGVLSVSAPASAAVGDWERISAYNGEVVAEPSPYTVNNEQVVTADYDVNFYPGQWLRAQVGTATDTFTFQNRWSRQCLDVEGGITTTAGSPVVQEPCDGTESQDWILIHDAYAATWHIKNSLSGLYLMVETGSGPGVAFKQADNLPTNTRQQFQIW